MTRQNAISHRGAVENVNQVIAELRQLLVAVLNLFVHGVEFFIGRLESPRFMRDVAIRTEHVRARDGKAYRLRLTPYRTLENKIDGVVLILLDISDLVGQGERGWPVARSGETPVIPAFGDRTNQKRRPEYEAVEND